MSHKSSLFCHAPHWRHLNPTALYRLPDTLASWLTETGSLTQRLRGIYGQQFGVKVLQQRWETAFIDESRILQLAPSQRQLVREVLLHAGDRPLVLARTILPAATINIARRNLSQLGNRPLGEVIFAYPDLERRRRQYACVAQAHWSSAINAEITVSAPVWGRRTVYAIHRQPLLVAEFFLPGLFYD